MLGGAANLLDGQTLHFPNRIEIRFNIFHREQPKEFYRGVWPAAPIWVEEDGTWVDDRSVELSSPSRYVLAMVADDKARRIHIVLRDQNRSLLVAAIHIERLLAIIGVDKRPTLIYVDMLPRSK
jgi:hypothetical protein